MTHRALWTFVAAAAALACAQPASAQPHGAGGANDNCFRLSQLSNTRPDGDRRIYLRVGVNSFYRIDLDLKVSEGGVSEPCFIKSITRLTPEEAAAIPRKVKP